MPITDFLVINANNYKNEVALVEINPEMQEKNRQTWREYSLIETNPFNIGRTELTWGEFDKRANRFANLFFQEVSRKGIELQFFL